MEDSLQAYRDLFRTGHPKIAVPRAVIASGIDELDREAQIADPGTLLGDPSMRSSRCHSIYFSSNAPGFLSFALDRLRPGGKLLLVVLRRSGAFHRGDDPRLLGQIRAGSRAKGAQIADCRWIR